MTPSRKIVLLVCCAQFFAYLDAGFWPALLPKLSQAWSLNNREAGWITAMHYIAYLVAAPLMLSLTDRISSKTIYLFGVLASAGAALCFAVIADGLWSAAASRALSGFGEAGRFMVAVKLLSDHIEARELSRGVAWNALTIGVASSLSFLCIDPLEASVGWRAAFTLVATGTLLGGLIVLYLVPSTNRTTEASSEVERNFDFWAVLRNRAAMAYVVAYSVHTLESVAFRGWVVAFLTYSATHSLFGSRMPAPTTVATMIVLSGTCASFIGNEFALRFDRDALVTLAFVASCISALLIAVFGVNRYSFAVVLVLLYGPCIYLDSATLTAGTSISAEPSRRGATLAVHSTVGYIGGVLGPIVIGAVLDVAGGASDSAWGTAFLLLGLIDLIGLACFWLVRPLRAIPV
jgi:MFS family permease